MFKIPVRLWALAVLSGLLQIVPFPIAGPVPHWRSALVFVALAPLLLALLGVDREGRPLRWRQAAALGYGSGVIWYMGSCYWIYPTMHTYGGIPELASFGILILFALYLGLYHALFGCVIGMARSSRLHAAGALVGAPFLWVAVELARSRVTGFPWDVLGTAQVDNFLLTQVAPWTGVYGLSFVILLVNTHLAGYWIFRQRMIRVQSLGIGLMLVLFIEVGGWHVHRFMPLTAVPRQTATLLQENLEVGMAAQGLAMKPQFHNVDEMYAEFDRLTLNPVDNFAAQRAAGVVGPVQLVVWPESPAPFETPEPGFDGNIARLAPIAKAPIISGVIGVVPDPTQPRNYRVFNSAVFINADGSPAGRYDKVHLVPWGEYVPFKQFFFFAKNLTQDVGDFDSGSQRNVFHANGHAYGTFICYESVFPNEVRQFVQNGADVLVNISNDGWYGDSGAPWQHLNMVRMRAIENHRWVLRATNTGITAAIDPYGRVRERAPRHERTAIDVGFNYENEMTFYTLHGDWFAWMCGVLSLLLCGASLMHVGQRHKV